MLSRVVLASIVIALVVGCSSGEDTPAEPGRTDASSDSATAGASPTESSEPSTPEVVAAVGKKLTLQSSGDVLSFRAPTRKWDASGSSASLSTLDGAWYVGGFSGPTFPHVSLDDSADIALDLNRGRFAKLRRVEDRTVSGIDGYVIEGGAGKELYYQFGALYGEVFATIEFELTEDTPEARATIESVLASVEWL